MTTTTKLASAPGMQEPNASAELSIRILRQFAGLGAKRHERRWNLHAQPLGYLEPDDTVEKPERCLRRELSMGPVNESREPMLTHRVSTVDWPTNGALGRRRLG